jgi:hypothetical protein
MQRLLSLGDPGVCCCTAVAVIAAATGTIQLHIRLLADRNVAVHIPSFLADMGTSIGLNTPIDPYALIFAASLYVSDYMGTQTHPSSHCRISLRSALIEYGLDFKR